MSNIRETLKAVVLAQKLGGAAEHRIALTTAVAAEAAKALDPTKDEIRHPELLAKALTDLDDIAQLEEPESAEAKIVFYKEVGKVHDRFWEAMECQVVEGLEIIRRR